MIFFRPLIFLSPKVQRLFQVKFEIIASSVESPQLTGSEKLSKLADTAAEVYVKAENFRPETEEFLRQKNIAFDVGAFEPRDLEGGYTLVIGATNDSDVNRSIMELCRQKAILFNGVDDPRNCDFFFSAEVKKSSLHIAISTGGTFPGAASAIRKWLESFLPASFGETFDGLCAERRLGD